MILGLDPATSCGFAVLRPNGTRVQSGAWDLSPMPTEGEGVDTGSRFWQLHDHLDRLLVTWPKISRVAYERIGGQVKSQDVALVLYGLAAHVESWASKNSLEYRPFAPAEVKNAAGLKGNAEKHEMVAAAERVWAPHSVETSDEADALFCALALLKEGT
ncbi:MAG TPA: crossover junction endodeoxyribonuclease RuvC [Candidatus Limnocylindria bacterium]|nr:crossover junction endodeoxyribonuclease RuvC [Candidatus Limnocylindria bacterium]